jgi:hypothetical protein
MEAEMPRSKSSIFLMSVLLAMANCSIQAVSTSKRYAALAVVPKHGAQYHGFAEAENRRLAIAKALKSCGNRGCTVVQTYRPGECVNIVLGNEQIWWDNQTFTMKAKTLLMQHCRGLDRNCRVLVAKCLPR